MPIGASRVSRNGNLGSAIPDSAILRYTLGEGSGTSASDSIGSNNLSIGSDSWVSDPSWQGGAALLFNGFTANPNSGISEIDSSNGFSIGLTINPDNTDNRVICEKLSSDSTGFTVGVNTGSAIVRDYNDNFVSNSITTGSKYRVLAGWDGSSSSIYVNDSEGAGSDTVSNGNASGSLIIGDLIGGGNAYAGNLDDFIVYNEQPSSSLATDDYNLQPWS